MATILIAVVVRALQITLALVVTAAGALAGVGALKGLVGEGVELLLLPSVVAGALTLTRAPLVVVADEFALLPGVALLGGVVGEQVRASAEVLPVVGVDAVRLVVFFVVDAPLCFEVKHVEVVVSVHFVKQWRLDVFVGVRKGAVVVVGALLRARTELGLVVFIVVEELHLVVRVRTLLILTARVGADLRRVRMGGEAAPLILGLVVETLALFGVVKVLSRALVNLEHLQVQVLPVVHLAVRDEQPTPRRRDRRRIMLLLLAGLFSVASRRMVLHLGA